MGFVNTIGSIVGFATLRIEHDVLEKMAARSSV